MGKGQGGASRRQAGTPTKGSRGISKPVSALGASVLAARAAASHAVSKQQSAASISASMAILQERSEVVQSGADVDALATKLLGLAREVLAEAGGEAIALSVLGDHVRDRASRRGLQATVDGTSRPLTKQLKTTWGGWGPFLRDRAPSEFILRPDGSVQMRSASSPAELVSAPSASSSVPSAALALPAVSSSDVNALSLDAL